MHFRRLHPPNILNVSVTFATSLPKIGSNCFEVFAISSNENGVVAASLFKAAIIFLAFSADPANGVKAAVISSRDEDAFRAPANNPTPARATPKKSGFHSIRTPFYI